jgi:arylsulfatase A-like enzyme
VAGVDESVGRILDWLAQKGLEKDTIVVYSSDQGFFLGDHGWYDKRYMYEQSIRMPLLVRAPGIAKAGAVNGGMVLNVDFAPAFLDLAGVPVPKDMQGRSFVPLLRGETPKDWREAMYYHYYEYDPNFLWAKVRPHYGVRTRRHKLIRYYTLDAWELYDLAADTGEVRNVYADPTYAETLKTLLAELARLRNELGDNTGKQLGG